MQLKKIEQNNDILHQSFISEENNSLNLLANKKSDNGFVTSIGYAGMLIFDELGQLIEIELLFIKPFLENYPLIECSNLQDGLPIFAVENSKQEKEPFLYLDKNNLRALILFERYPIDLIVSCGNAHFLFSNKKLIGIESTNIVFDDGCELQTK
ncbi:MAG TPA: hypothetical protein VFF04_02220 [Candidatus Babeliales bacterium]|nr:hypothetical protein [Candidatus Babeliales bacterium]